jgi:peptide/nickel transport system permease protein
MFGLILRRLASAVVVLVALTGLLFLLQSISPFNPVRALVGERAPAAVVARASRLYGYDRPWLVQYASYLNKLAHLQLGMSLRTHDPVSKDLVTFIPPTIELVVTAAIMAIFGGLVLGIITARGGRTANVFRVLMLISGSIPIFLFAILMILLFYGKLGWLPAVGQTSVSNAPTGPTGFLVLDSILHGQLGTTWDALEHLFLPALTLALVPAVAIGRSLGSSLFSSLRADYIKTARMKGIPEAKVLFRHAMRNSMNSALAMTGLQIGASLGVVTIVEVIFSWPGVGNYFALSVASDDLPAMFACALLIGACFITINLIVDILQVLTDPRIAYR